MTDVLKIAGAGAVLFAVAFAITTLAPDGTVRRSDADVVSFDWFDTTPSARFANALEQLGHEEPRAYRMGRETVYFSARPTRRDPRQLIDEYQRAFVTHGVNQEMHTTVTSPRRRGAAGMLYGEVMLLQSEPEQVTMGGGVLRSFPRNRAEMRAKRAQMDGANFNDMLRGIRYVRAEKIAGRTVVTAVWTDDEFDIRRANTPQPSDPDLPACRGCVVEPGFGTIENDIERRIVRYASPEPVRVVENFYDRVLARRGWVLQDEPESGRIRTYVRDEDRTSILVQRRPGSTSITGVVGD